MKGEEIHLLLDHYVSPLIIDIERSRIGALNNPKFFITGSNQVQRQSGKELLKNGAFKEEFSRFIMQEWKTPHYGPILGIKVLYVSDGGKCLRYRNMETVSSSQVAVDTPSHMHARHEEAVTLMAFHAAKTQGKNTLVRSTDTDVLVILIGLAGRIDNISLIMDYGSGNHRRYINISLIATKLEEIHSGLTTALIGYHALTGSDFTSAFNRKGKTKPFEKLEAKDATLHVKAMQSLTSNVDVTAVTSYVCALYGCKATNID